MEKHLETIEKITTWVGSLSSLIVHTILFIASLIVGALGLLSWDTVLLVLTTGVSLEAIYLAIFIQMSVNQQSQTIKEVEHDIDEIQEDIDAIEEDVDEMHRDDEEEEVRDIEYQKTLTAMSTNLQRILDDIEKMKKD